MVARQSDQWKWNTLGSPIIPELRSLKWRHLEVFENSSFPSGVCEVFDAKYTSKKTEARIFSAWTLEVYGTQQKSKSRCRSSKAKWRAGILMWVPHACGTHIKIPARWTQIGAVCASIYLNLLPIVNFESVQPLCVLVPVLEGRQANVYTMHGHSYRMRSATFICYLCARVHNFFRIPACWNKKTNKMEVRNHAARMFCLHLHLCREIHGPIILKLSFQWLAVHFDF